MAARNTWLWQEVTIFMNPYESIPNTEVSFRIPSCQKVSSPMAMPTWTNYGTIRIRSAQLLTKFQPAFASVLALVLSWRKPNLKPELA